MKESLKEGTITKEEVMELEKIMGGDIAELLNALKKFGGGGGGKQVMGTDFKEMIEIFNSLLEIKRKQ